MVYPGIQKTNKGRVIACKTKIPVLNGRDFCNALLSGLAVVACIVGRATARAFHRFAGTGVNTAARFSELAVFDKKHPHGDGCESNAGNHYGCEDEFEHIQVGLQQFSLLSVYVHGRLYHYRRGCFCIVCI